MVLIPICVFTSTDVMCFVGIRKSKNNTLSRMKGKEHIGNKGWDLAPNFPEDLGIFSRLPL